MRGASAEERRRETRLRAAMVMGLVRSSFIPALMASVRVSSSADEDEGCARLEKGQVINLQVRPSDTNRISQLTSESQ